MELWNADGSGYEVTIGEITTVGTASAQSDAWLDTLGDLGFLRVYTTTVEPGSKPPTTAETGDWANWKFDGNGDDSSASGNANISTTGAEFVATPGQVAYAFPKTGVDQESFVLRPLRAGYPSTLYGSDSFSMADGSNAVTCFWQQIPHEDGQPLTSVVQFSDREACDPTVTGLVFGPYQFRLVVTDVGGAESTVDLEAGAVAWDDNCVVIYPDERLYTLIGPQLANGCNPWGYAENRFDAQSRELANGYVVNGGGWEMPSLKTDVNGEPITGTVYWTETGNLRTLLGIGTNFLKHFCGGVVGPATGDWILVHVPDPAWGGDVKRTLAFFVTSCTSDTEIEVDTWVDAWYSTTLASPGLPWYVWDHSNQPGEVQGTVYAANGATTVYGSGTDLQDLCDGGTTPRSGASVQFLVTPVDDERLEYSVSSCVSETEITISLPFEGTTIASPGAGFMSRWTAGTYLGDWTLTGSDAVQWYDQAGAHYRHYFGSGWYRSLKAARYLIYANPYNPYNFQWQGLWETQFSPMLAAVIDPAAWGPGVSDPWPWMVTRANRAASDSFIDRPVDQRSVAYAAWYVANVALYHPVEATREAMKDLLIDHYEKQASVYRDPESGGNYTQYADTVTEVWQVVNGSTTATKVSGTDITSSFCGVRYQPGGTISIASDDVTVTGSGTNFVGSANKYVVLRGTLSSQPHIEISRVDDSTTPTATSLVLEYPWRGDDGSITDWWILDSTGDNLDYAYPVFSWQQVNSGGTLAVPNVTDLLDMYYCTYASPTSITLDHAYTGDTSSGNVYRKQYKQNYTPFFAAWRQPFMDGMVASSYYLAYKALDGYDETASNGFLALTKDLLDALYDDRDQASNGQQYFRMSPMCKPYNYNVATICDQNPGANNGERDYWLESIGPMSMWYLEAGTSEYLTKFDQVYNWVYARPGWASPTAGDGYYSGWQDTIGWKKHGQGNGVGGGATWPAARLGGAVPVELRTHLMSFAKPAWAHDIEVTARNAQGAPVVTVCTSSPCAVQYDHRAGGVVATFRYRDSMGGTLASTTAPVHIR